MCASAVTITAVAPAGANTVLLVSDQASDNQSHNDNQYYNDDDCPEICFYISYHITTAFLIIFVNLLHTCFF